MLISSPKRRMDKSMANLRYDCKENRCTWTSLLATNEVVLLPNYKLMSIRSWPRIWVHEVIIHKSWPIGSMYAIYGNIYHQYTPFMLAYIPAPWILWVIDSCFVNTRISHVWCSAIPIFLPLKTTKLGSYPYVIPWNNAWIWLVNISMD